VRLKKRSLLRFTS
jgi:hypothetical protein